VCGVVWGVRYRLWCIALVLAAGNGGEAAFGGEWLMMQRELPTLRYAWRCSSPELWPPS
jgi:hypothetical protein